MVARGALPHGHAVDVHLGLETCTDENGGRLSRALRPCCACHRAFLSLYAAGRRMTLLSIFAMLGGSAAYVWKMPTHDLTSGLFWIFANMLFAVADRLLQRVMLTKEQRPVYISLTGVTMISNAQRFVILLFVAWLKDEFEEVLPAISALTGLQVSNFFVLVNINKFEEELGRDRAQRQSAAGTGGDGCRTSSYGTVERGAVDEWQTRPTLQVRRSIVRTSQRVSRCSFTCVPKLQEETARRREDRVHRKRFHRFTA